MHLNELKALHVSEVLKQAEELEIELKLLETLGKAKKDGKFIIPSNTFYEM